MIQLGMITILLVSFLLVMRCGEGKKGVVCPTWTHPNTSGSPYKCVCGVDIDDVIICYGDATVQIRENFCVFFSESTLIGSCPYSSGGILPQNVSTLDHDGTICSTLLHRKGRLCGECEDNYSLPVYSYSYGCVKCDPRDFKYYGWIKFITAALLPLTIFYILVIIFRVSVNSSSLNGFVLVSQLVAIPPMIRYIYDGNQINPSFYVSYFTQFIVDLGIAVYAVWNLDFFRSFYKPICPHPNMTYPQVAILDYAIAVYPLLLIFITFILVKLHDNFMFVVKIWRPFNRCFALFRKQWNVHSSLVNALATFITLSYIKILNVSFELLLPSRIYNEEGQQVNMVLLYYNGTIDMTSRAYFPYLMLALIMLLTFNILPLVLLTVYPFRCFQVLLSKCFSLRYKLALQIFMDAFHGCYKHTPRDYRHFASLYFALRFFNLLVYSIFYEKVYFPTASLLLVFTLALIAKFRPYKEKKSNTVDVVMMFTLISAYTAIVLNYLHADQWYPKWVNRAIRSVPLLIPPSYIIFLVLAQIYPKLLHCFITSKAFVAESIDKIKIKKKLKEQALFNYGGVNYHTMLS